MTLLQILWMWQLCSTNASVDELCEAKLAWGVINGPFRYEEISWFLRYKSEIYLTVSCQIIDELYGRMFSSLESSGRVYGSVAGMDRSSVEVSTSSLP